MAAAGRCGRHCRRGCGGVWTSPQEKKEVRNLPHTGTANRALRILGKAAVSAGAALLALAAAAAVFFGSCGYRMYQDAVAETPVASKVGAIRGQEGFTPWEGLPQRYVDAVLAAEDQRFFRHNGVDAAAIARALWNDLRTLSFAEGGSTITQQLMKNLYFTQEKTLERKFAEVFAAWEMEKVYPKKEIFELYVNTIYFGSGYYGIYDAAEGYFSVEPAELSDAQCVVLAGLPNAPSAYSPDASPELALQRTRQVLNRMEECGSLTGEAATQIYEEAQGLFC